MPTQSGCVISNSTDSAQSYSKGINSMEMQRWAVHFYVLYYQLTYALQLVRTSENTQSIDMSRQLHG